MRANICGRPKRWRLLKTAPKRATIPEWREGSGWSKDLVETKEGKVSEETGDGIPKEVGRETPR